VDRDKVLTMAVVTLGARRGGESLLDLLAGCHQRIRHFSALARTVAASPDAPDAPAAAAAVRRYFADALPLHEADEEQSVAPRLLGRDPTVDAALATMAAQHAAHAILVADLLAACATPHTLAAPAAALESAMATHLAAEEALIFPAVLALPAPVQAAIIAELRARRT
jgi:iron-sulfur cluster repair protein YtfE (RIC family)